MRRRCARGLGEALPEFHCAGSNHAPLEKKAHSAFNSMEESLFAGSAAESRIFFLCCFIIFIAIAIF
jgi:hypothetical protein